MKAELFSGIVDTLEAHLLQCRQHLTGIESTDDLLQLTVAQAREVRAFCKEEEPKMTRLVQTDLYHIIGMGNLSPVQMMKFTYLVRDYLQYRSTIKTIAAYFDRISALPGLPVASTYTSRFFDNLTLCTNFGFPETVDSDSTLPYIIEDKVIRVTRERAAEFVELWAELANNKFSLSNLQKNAKANSDYGGISWSLDEHGNFIGIFKTRSGNVLEAHYKKNCNI